MAERSNFQNLLDVGLRTVFFDRYEQEPQVMPSIFSVNTSDRDIETDSGVTGFGKLQQTDELGTLDYEDPLKMYNTVYRHKKYTKGFRVSEELMEDDQYNVIKKMPGALAKSVVYTTESYAASVLNNGFNTGYTSYGDGLPLFSTAHTRVDGGTNQSNASAAGITLTEGNLEPANLALEKVLNDKGEIVHFMADTLIIPVDLRKTANIITGSEMRPGTANNDTNIYQNAYKVVPWRYLTSTTAWFLADSNQHQLTWFWRLKPEYKSDYSFNAGASLNKVRVRFSYGWSDWRGIWGSKGDGAAYAS